MSHPSQDPTHGHDRPRSVSGFLRGLVGGHDHHHGPDAVDPRLESSSRGIWALKVSLLGLAATASFQVVIVLISGSVALLADTIHNFSDALTAVPLWIAFVLGRRAATSRYPYGYGRAEDLAGVFIVLMIAASAGLAGWESIQRLISPQPISNLGWVMVAAIVGFAGGRRLPHPGRARDRARRPWSPTATTRAPMASPAWRCCSAPSACGSAFRWPTRWSGWPSPSPSCSS
jgi:hypothetical protein